MKQIESVKIQRDSAIELLRIIAMWMIVFYHFHVHVLSTDSGFVFFKAIQIPIHISVPLFVLISGYFGICFNTKGLCRLFTQVGFYSLSLLFIVYLISLFSTPLHSLSKQQIVNGLFFISRTNNLWFIRTYLLLYLISPFWNKVLQGQTSRQRTFLLMVLAFMVFYMSNIGQLPDLSGKSIIYFLFLYTIGHSIREYKLSERFKAKWLLSLFLTMNLLLVVLYMVGYKNVLFRVGLWTLAFKYNSPLCVLSAIAVFMLFTKMSFQNYFVNKIAASVFAVYLISENTLVNVYLNDIVRYLLNSFSVAPMYVLLVVLTTSVILFCVLIDKLTLGPQRYLSICLSICLDKVINKIKMYI